ncbi:hypothetical protein [Runella sp.]|uniref:hypothetical protein n=1 Tax=Runella sp. TaxID=1960881 RepID=UPI003D0C9993
MLLLKRILNISCLGLPLPNPYTVQLIFLMEWEGVLIWLGFGEFVRDMYYKYAP